MLDWEQAQLGRQVNGSRVIGLVDNFVSLLDDHVVDEVVFLVPRKALELIDPCVQACEERGIRTRVAVDLFTLGTAKPRLNTYLGIPMVTYQHHNIPMSRYVLKRVLDVAISGAGLLACIPLFLMIGSGHQSHLARPAATCAESRGVKREEIPAA